MISLHLWHYLGANVLQKELNLWRFFGHEDSEAKKTLTFHHRWWPTLQVLRFPYLFALQEHDAARIFKARPQWTHAPGLHLRRCMVGLERLWSTVCLSAWLLLWELCSKFATVGMMKVYVGIFHRCRRDGGGSGSHLEMVGNCLSIPFGKKWHKFSVTVCHKSPGTQPNSQVMGEAWMFWLLPFTGPDGTGVEWGIEEAQARLWQLFSTSTKDHKGFIHGSHIFRGWRFCSLVFWFVMHQMSPS